MTNTVEILEPPSSTSSYVLKKIATSSTLNSYGKSSSIQSKMTNTTNNSSSRKKQNLSASSTRADVGNSQIAQIGESFKLNSNNSNNTNKTAFDVINRRLKSGIQQKPASGFLLTRQSKTLSLNNDENYRKSSDTLINNRKNSTLTLTNQVQSLKPTPLPRTANNQDSRRTSSLHRQANNNSFVPVTTSIENSAFITSSSNRKDLTTIKLIYKPNEMIRPKTSFTSRQMPNQYNCVNGKLSFQQPQNLMNNNGITTTSVLKLKSNEANKSSSGHNLLPNEADDYELGDSISLSNFQNEANGFMNEFTLMRIIKWLKDIEKCTNMMKPPAQLTWSNRTENTTSIRQRENQHLANNLQPQNEFYSKNINPEYLLV